MRSILLILFLHFFVISSMAQSDSCWTLMLLDKGNNFEVKDDMGAISKTGFYLYRNCIYEIDLKNQKHFSGRLIDFKPDTLFLTNFFNANVAFKAQSILDTFAIHIKELNKLNLIADRAMGIYSKYSFDNFDFIFKKDTTNCSVNSFWDTLFTNDQALYEVVPHLTEQGINYLFEENGRTFYYYGGGMLKPDRSKIDDTYDINNVFSFTPCKSEEINGIALGMYTKNVKNREFGERDSLIVRGLALEINPLQMLGILSPHLSGPLPDSIEFYQEKTKKDWQVKVHGVNITLINNINEMEIKGLNITGVFTVVDEIHGLSISGLNNFCYILNGVSIAAIRNRATVAKGLQIGLYNKATDLRGFQFGLWNSNGKRSLPFVNWQFRPKK